MGGVELIVEQIIHDAKKQAQAIREETDLQIAEHELNARTKAEETVREIEKKAEADCIEEERRFSAIMDLESRKELLMKKRMCIDKAFVKAGQKILALDDAAYSAFLFGFLKKAARKAARSGLPRGTGGFLMRRFCRKRSRRFTPASSAAALHRSLRPGLCLYAEMRASTALWIR